MTARSTRSTMSVIVLAGMAGATGWGTAHWLALEPAAALAQRPTPEKTDFDTLHDGLQISGYVRDEVTAQGGSAIPVLVPWEMTRDATTARTHRFRLKIAPDGYTALLGDEALDYVINGTAHRYSRSDGDPNEEHRPDPRSDPGHEGGEYMMPYEDFDDGRGGSLAFGFRGADYQVELYCLAEAPDPEANCLEAATVEGFARSLMGQ